MCPEPSSSVGDARGGPVFFTFPHFWVSRLSVSFTFSLWRAGKSGVRAVSGHDRWTVVTCQTERHTCQHF